MASRSKFVESKQAVHQLTSYKTLLVAFRVESSPNRYEATQERMKLAPSPSSTLLNV